MSVIFQLLAPLLLWLASFSAIYGLHGLGCAQGWSAVEIGPLSLFRMALVVAWGVVVAAQIMLFRLVRNRIRRAPKRDLPKTRLIIGWTALVASVWTLFPVAVLTSCQ